jgi:flagellar motor protein MotB
MKAPMGRTPMEHEDPLAEGLHAWPAFVDLLAATTMIFIVFLGVFTFVSVSRIHGLETQRDAIFERLQSGTGDGLYQLERDSQFIRIIIPDSVTFPSGVSTFEALGAGGRTALDTIGRILKADAVAGLYREVRVLGHTDEDPYTGGDYSNWELSSARAAVVARFLDKSVGLDPCKLSASGLGPYHPSASATGRLTNQQRKEQDRRIEIEIVPALAQVAGGGDLRPCDPARWR